MASKTITEGQCRIKIPMPWVVGMIGERFGRIVVLEYIGHRDYVAYLRCKCDCGCITVASAVHIRNGRTSSCGCFRSQVVSERLTKHGHAPLVGKRLPSYVSWQSMMSRCYNPNNSHFKHYGGRGIIVCGPWHDFTNFLSDMGETAKGMSIERRDNDLNYCKENCLWIPKRDQPKNRRHNWRVEIDGEVVTAREATRRLGVPQNSIADKLRHAGFRKDESVPVSALGL